MVKVFVSRNLEKEIVKRLSKKDADAVFLQLFSLEDNPHKGEFLTVVGNVVFKELKHKKFRFYFIHSITVLNILTLEELQDGLIKCISMSAKGKEQQKIINRIKKDLKSFGFDWF